VAIPLNYGAAVLPERIRRALQLPVADLSPVLLDLTSRFGGRHRDLTATLHRHWDHMARLLGLDSDGIPEQRRLIAAAYVTMEYSIEAAALCNPSMVPAPDQAGAGPGELRVVLSLRAIGEGHRSAIEFRTGTLDADGRLGLDPVTRWASLGEIDPGDRVGAYTVRFDPTLPLSERVLCAATPDESSGLEDARFVALEMPDGRTTFAATYTAYDGRALTPKLLRTDDFATFTVDPMTGLGARDKGAAIFPRQIDGRWWAVSRQNGQSLFVMSSPDLVDWDAPTPLADPVHDWELVQMGNCGSPIETDAGWLVVTHGVGMLRRYVLGALLLDRDDPTKVLGRLDRPLLEPDDREREGYVPNALYSCGGLVHAGHLVLPYAYADQACTVASFDVKEIIAAMR
jgi:predicted GH43/DUF377 family glycosyl hydrolase